MSRPSWTILSIHINHFLISYPSLKKWDLSVYFKSLLPSCHPCLGCSQVKHRNLWQKTPSVPSYPWNFPNPCLDPEVNEPTSFSSIEPLSLTKNNQVFPHTKPVSSTSETGNTTVQTHGLSALSRQDKKKPLPQAPQNFGQAEMSTKAMQ